MTNLLIYYTQEDTIVYDLGDVQGEELEILNLLHNKAVNEDELTPDQEVASSRFQAMIADRPYEDLEKTSAGWFCRWKDKKVDMALPWIHSGATRVWMTGFIL